MADRSNRYNTLDGLHHIGVINTDLDLLSERYEKLGFLLTPLSTPRIALEPGGRPEALGVGNRHAIFENNYLELLGIVDPSRWKSTAKDNLGPYNIDIPLSRYQGLHVMHFNTSHIELVRERLHGHGIPCSEIKSFQRNVQTDLGEQTMKARTIAFPSEANPEGLIQIAQHDTPELVFQPKYMNHSNGALKFTELILCCEEPEAYIHKYERLTAQQGVRVANKYYTIDLGNSEIVVIAPQHIPEIIPDFAPPAIPFMLAFTIETRDLQLTRDVLERNEVNFTEKKESITVDPHYAGGCAVIFKPYRF